MEIGLKLWRLTRSPFVALDGKGAELHGARYADSGTAIVSFAYEAGLAVLVALRYHLALGDEAPNDYVLGWMQSDETPVKMPTGTEQQTRDAISEWVKEGKHLFASIRSKVLPEGNIIYMNARHPDAAKVPPLIVRSFDFADCLHTPPMFERYRNQQ